MYCIFYVIKWEYNKYSVSWNYQMHRFLLQKWICRFRSLCGATLRRNAQCAPKQVKIVSPYGAHKKMHPGRFLSVINIFLWYCSKVKYFLFEVLLFSRISSMYTYFISNFFSFLEKIVYKHTFKICKHTFKSISKVYKYTF